ncbi:MAG: hypothetical protein VXY56_10115, partial [Pseudomonadota bacterium]|nr:hypothetical protein [Pseudomonadota bacterium]
TSGGFFAADRYIEYGPTDEFGLRISRGSVGKQIATQTLNSTGEPLRPSSNLGHHQIPLESENTNVDSKGSESVDNTEGSGITQGRRSTSS